MEKQGALPLALLESLAEEELPKGTEKEEPMAWEENQVNMVSWKLDRDRFKQAGGVNLCQMLLRRL